MSSPEKYILGLAAVGMCLLVAAKHKDDVFVMPEAVAQVASLEIRSNPMHDTCKIEVRDQSLGELSNEYVDTMCNCVVKIMGNWGAFATDDPETAWAASKNVCRHEYKNGGLYPFMKKYPN